MRYLESHARRIYASGEAGDTAEAARAILEKIRKGDLLDGFKLREIQQKGWAKLGSRDPVQAGLDRLCELGWIAVEWHAPGHLGGRPSKVYRVNPKTWRR